ncbi:putative guanine deaminase [Cladobotryum mycophilum]|uniref:Guanine deaminase n=1 Tax=Cladobotryum mycophilum TaxID=491253 RepID=A0ABR0T1J8_9HYPO
MSPQRKLILLGTFVHSKSRQELEFIHNAALGVDSFGKIAEFIKDAGDIREAQAELLQRLGWSLDEVDVREAKSGQFFFPGFIDTHIHAPQYANAGIFGKSTLLDWLNKYTFPLEASLKDLTKARRIYSTCIRRTLSHGTTTAAYYATIDVAATNLLADLCLSMGQRAFVGRVCMDDGAINPDYYRDESAEEGRRATLDTIAHIKAIDPGYDIVSPILTPRFAPSCTPQAMRDLAQIHRETGLPIQTHVSENASEIELVATKFPESSSYTGVYDDHGLLTPRTILAHGVHLSEEEADLIALRKSKVSHCPCSNTSLTSGMARVNPSILDAARQAALVSRCVAMGYAADEEKEKNKLTVEEALYLATRGGAQVVGLEDKIGGFDVGMDWDAQLVGLYEVGPTGVPDTLEEDDSFVDTFGWETWDDRLAKWLFNGDDRNTKSVWVKGRLVHTRR